LRFAGREEQRKEEEEEEEKEAYFHCVAGRRLDCGGAHLSRCTGLELTQEARVIMTGARSVTRIKPARGRNE
jgi:hypothetical protein